MRSSRSTFARHGASFRQRPLALALTLALGVAPLAAQAATIIVTTTGDAGGGSTCTLRQAIVSANTGAATGTCAAGASPNTINFDTTTFPNGGANTITLADVADNQLSITDANLTIDATANDIVTIQRPSGAANNFGIMYDSAAAGGSLTLNHLTLSNGNVTASTCNSRQQGGGICIPTANLVLTNSTLSGNSALVQGGGIYSKSGSVTLANSTVSGNSSSAFGGGIESNSGSVTLTNSTVNNNSAGTGGGIYSSIGSVTLTNSTLSGNAAQFGGGIGFSLGSVTLINSTLSGNAARFGGGIGTIRSSGSVMLTNSTLSGNSASSQGGGIYASGSVTLTNSTISGNSAGSTGGGINGGTVTANNSIIAGNTQTGSGDVNPVVSAGSNNLIGSVANLNLGTLADNGGPTQTMLPLAGSVAIDAVPSGSCTVTADQRGIPRPQGALCDIGAVEVVMPQALTVSVTGNGSVSASATPAPQSGSIATCTSAGGTNCAANYAQNQTITLTATPDLGDSFVGWSGDCVSAGSTSGATVTMDVAKTCTAAFAVIVTPAPAVPAPTLSRWTLLLLGGLLAGLGLVRARRRQDV